MFSLAGNWLDDYHIRWTFLLFFLQLAEIGSQYFVTAMKDFSVSSLLHSYYFDGMFYVGIGLDKLHRIRYLAHVSRGFCAVRFRMILPVTSARTGDLFHER